MAMFAEKDAERRILFTERGDPNSRVNGSDQICPCPRRLA
jgi:hypothetical protein